MRARKASIQTAATKVTNMLYFVCFASSVNQAFFALKYSLVSFTTVPDKRNTAIKFGIDISPLNVSAILHNNPKSTVAPRIATSE